MPKTHKQNDNRLSVTSGVLQLTWA